MSLMFVDWEDRPALVSGRAALFVKRGTSAWASADVDEVFNSGAVVSEARFKALFPSAPPIPSAIVLHGDVSAPA